MNSIQPSKHSRNRIALWTPLPPLKTGIADYITELLPYLVNYFDLEIFVDDSYAVSDDLLYKYKIFKYQNYSQRNQDQPFDLNIYQMGNNEFHKFIYDQALIVPGLVVLHDLSLSLMLYHHYAGIRNDLDFFRKEFLFSEGEQALKKFDRLYNKGDNEGLMDFFSDHHLLRRLVGRNYAIVSHLEYCATIARDKYKAERAYSMYLGSPDPMLELTDMSKQEARRLLDIPDGQFVVGVFGFLQPNKQNDVMLRALARIKSKHPNVLVVFVGEMNPGLSYDRLIQDLISSLNLENNVRLTGFASHDDMQRYFIACDAVVNLRYPSFGQMSATLSRGIATGRPVIITDLPEWDFFPETFCWRVSAEDTEGRQIASLVCRLIENPEERKKRGASAREFFLKNGTSEQAATNLTNIVSEVINSHPEQVRLRLEDFPSVSQIDRLKTTFDNWILLRIGGNARYKFEKLRNIPLLGSIFVYFLIFASNLINIREIRRAEQALFKNLIEEISWLDSQIRRFEPAPVRVLDNPMTWIPTYHPDLAKREKLKSSDEYFYLEFENAFRGSEAVIRNRQRKVLSEIKAYVSLEANASILDLGCGRGEFLSLLISEGVSPIGVDSNQLAINDLKEKGFEVYAQDMFTYLSSIPDATFKGITAFHVVEHLTHEQIMKFLPLVYQKLMPGGFLYLETPNPLCLESFTRFYTDPTHQRPFQPFQLSFLLEYNSFEKLRLLFLQPTGHGSADPDRDWLSSYQDYGVLAMK